MLNTPHPKEFLECAGGERWATVGAEFFWGTICLEQLSTNGHKFGCCGVTQPVSLSAQARYV